jgi:hypothetical protein
MDSLLYDLNWRPVSENKALLEIINSCDWSSLSNPQREARTSMPQQVHVG